MAASVAARTRDDGSVEWQTTRFTRDKLGRDGFKVLDTVTISCVYHPPKDGASAWYELTHVYVPATALPELLVPATKNGAAHGHSMAQSETVFFYGN